MSYKRRSLHSIVNLWQGSIIYPDFDSVSGSEFLLGIVRQTVFAQIVTTNLYCYVERKSGLAETERACRSYGTAEYNIFIGLDRQTLCENWRVTKYVLYSTIRKSLIFGIEHFEICSSAKVVWLFCDCLFPYNRITHNINCYHGTRGYLSIRCNVTVCIVKVYWLKQLMYEIMPQYLPSMFIDSNPLKISIYWNKKK